MNIQLSDHVALKLMTIANITEGLEFSGFGFVDLNDDVIYVYDVVVLDIGSEVFTEIAPKSLISLMERPDAKKMKLWIHRHPLGNGVPGIHNWSGTDNNTIQQAPLGGHPDLVKWSCSMVLTPKGWVGRIDNHLKNITQHLEVVPQCREAYVIIDEIRSTKPKTQSVVWDEGFCYPDVEDYLEEKHNRNEIRKIAKERFPLSFMDDLGLTLDDITELLLDAYYYGDDELMDAFLDPATTNQNVSRMLTERITNGSY